MRIIFKILAAPFVLVLTLLVAVLSFLLSLSAGLLSILASVLGLLSVLMLFVEKDISTGIAGLLMAFAISPFGHILSVVRNQSRFFLCLPEQQYIQQIFHLGLLL